MADRRVAGTVAAQRQRPYTRPGVSRRRLPHHLPSPSFPTAWENGSLPCIPASEPLAPRHSIGGAHVHLPLLCGLGRGGCPRRLGCSLRCCRPLPSAAAPRPAIRAARGAHCAAETTVYRGRRSRKALRRPPLRRRRRAVPARRRPKRGVNSGARRGAAAIMQPPRRAISISRGHTGRPDRSLKPLRHTFLHANPHPSPATLGSSSWCNRARRERMSRIHAGT